jgi:hypothetical protein
MPKRDRREVEKARQLQVERGAPQLGRWLLRRYGNQLYVWVVKLSATWCLLGLNYLAGDGEDGLREELGDFGRLGGVIDYDLAETCAVAEDQERDLAELALPVKPAHQRHPLADVVAELADQSPP